MHQLLVLGVTILFFICIIHITHSTSSTTRKTQYGWIQGKRVRSLANPEYEFYSFKGVPYAKPPVGKLRFQEPTPPKKWLGVKKTIDSVLKCAQISQNTYGDELAGSEDCLYLEVFEPITARNNNTSLLPVMVWIHGGTFIFGAANITGPDYLMEKPVVVVTLQYRVNVFGFLSTLDKHAKGNNGLKDQNFALKWVQNNIHNFGGDPNEVTIFGESAGGASVLYHILSQKSRGLFHGAISQSGTTLNRWGYQRNPLEKVLLLAKGLGINSTNTKTIVKKLQKVDAETLVFAAYNKSIVGWFTPYYSHPFGPSTETESNTAFMSESTFKLLETSNYTRVPYLLGFNTEEGSFAYDYIANGRVDIKIYEDHPELLIPSAMNVLPNSSCEKSSIEDIKRFYFKDGNVTNFRNWIPYISQDIFVRGIIKTMEFMYRQVPTYLYRFSYAGSRQNSYTGGVGHYEEIKYLWYPRVDSANESTSDLLTRKRLITLWTNFATYSNPTPVKDKLLENIAWPVVDTNKRYLEFGLNLSIATNPNQADSEFWEDLFQRCGNPPYYLY